MAVGTHHLAFKHRMARTSVQRCALVLMAGKTDIELGGPVAHRVVHTHYIVAVCAGIAGTRMWTHLPV